MAASMPTSNGSADRQKPLLFFTAMPGEGHTYPLLNVASSMIKRGYPVVFHGGAMFEVDVQGMGAEFIPGPSLQDPVADPAGILAAGEAITDQRLSLLVHGLTHWFYNTMAMRTQALEDALVGLRARDPTRQIIVVHELCSMNVIPFAYGRPVPKGFSCFPKTVGIGTVSVAAPSRDTAPFGMGLPFDVSRACLLRNAELHRLADQGPCKPLAQAASRAMQEAGATTGHTDHPFTLWYAAPDVCFQLCSASMEYPLSDMPSKLRFAGCPPPKVSGGDFKAPSWWGEVLEYAADKSRRIVFVSQGTAHVDYSQLIVPTMEAFREREDVLVIATLGVRGATPGEGVNVPLNTRLIDFLAYDQILPFADVFVCNAGYGSTCHAVTNGTPAVLAGEMLDKKEVALRAVHAGYAWDLESSTPTVEQIREGVETVLSDMRFKDMAMRLKAENEAMDCMGTIEKQIIDFTE